MITRLTGPALLATLVVACTPGATTPPATTAAPPSPAEAQATGPGQPGARLQVLAAETFLADITRQVAGDRAGVDALVPLGVDPHAFEPTPTDVRKVAEADVVVANGAGLEGYLAKLLATAGGDRPVIEAARGLQMRTRGPGEAAEGHGEEQGGAAQSPGSPAEAGDPHFWLDPVLVMTYAENIRDGLTAADPAGKAVYAANTEAYQQQLAALDDEIRLLLADIPPSERLLVTNHESLGYFADRYGFTIVGTILPGASTGASPSARQLAALVDRIRSTGARAIFLEVGANPQLARQVAAETGARVVTDLYTHSVTVPDGPAPTYIDMLRANARMIAGALLGAPPDR